MEKRYVQRHALCVSVENMKRLHVLGTGTALVTKYYNTAFVLDNEKEYLLVDGMGGTEVLKCFETMELDWRKMHMRKCWKRPAWSVRRCCAGRKGR